jgi:hypothetical protein
MTRSRVNADNSQSNARSFATTTEPTGIADGTIWVDTDGTPAATQRLRWKKTPTAGTTVFTGLNDDGNQPLIYATNYEEVFLNGILLVRGVDYSATDGSTVTLVEPTVAGDIMEIFTTPNLAITDVYTTGQADAKYLPKSLVDAKGDLYVATADNTTARLAVGGNDQVLVADSAATSGVAWKSYGAQQVAGKNFIINGNFDVWSRGISFSFAAGGATTSRYCVDRWSYGGEANFTISRQTAVNPGSSYALRLQRNNGATSTGDQFLNYVMESSMAQMFAGKTATLSFSLRSGANFSGISTYAILRTGTGTDEGVASMYGSGWAGYVQTIRTQVPTTTRTRYSFTFTIPSNVKELGFLLGYNTASGTAGANDWIEYEQIQFEIGETATPFSRAGGTIAGEIQECQRYYQRFTAGSTGYTPLSDFGLANTTTQVTLQIRHSVTMRTDVYAVDHSGLSLYGGTGGFASVSSVSLTRSNGQFTEIAPQTTGLTLGQFFRLQPNNVASAYIGFNAEL